MQVLAQTVQVRATVDGRGNGAFAVAPISIGTYICDYEGERLNQDQYFERYPDGTVSKRPRSLGHADILPWHLAPNPTPPI